MSCVVQMSHLLTRYLKCVPSFNSFSNDLCHLPGVVNITLDVKIRKRRKNSKYQNIKITISILKDVRNFTRDQHNLLGVQIPRWYAGNKFTGKIRFNKGKGNTEKSSRRKNEKSKYVFI